MLITYIGKHLKHAFVVLNKNLFFIASDSLYFIFMQNNATPLYVASQKGHHRVVHALLQAGADVNIATLVSIHYL